MVDDLLRSCAEASSSNQGSGQRTDNHVDFGRINILMLRNASSRPAKDTKRPCLVQNEAKLVLQFQLNLRKEKNIVSMDNRQRAGT